MTTQDTTDQYAAAFRERHRGRTPHSKRLMVGHSGPLGDVFLPPEVVDDIEAAINEAFEQVEQVRVDEQPTF